MAGRKIENMMPSLCPRSSCHHLAPGDLLKNRAEADEELGRKMEGTTKSRGLGPSFCPTS
jgi:hypothetical protein